MSGIWEKVKLHQGEIFHTVTGLAFTYEAVGNRIVHTRSKESISRSDFEKAVRLNPQKPSDLHNDVRGPSYIFAIITDNRIGCDE